MTDPDKIEQASTDPDKVEKVEAGPDKFLARRLPAQAKLNRWRDPEKAQHDKTVPDKIGI